MAVSDEVAKDEGKSANQVSEAEPVESTELTELQKYWKAVKENPSDFTGWTYLLQFVEQENDIEAAREAFDAFLTRYPYCYGYWKKYADLERKNENLDETEKVYEKGLKAIPLSIDLWIHYINFAAAKYEKEDNHLVLIRGFYEKALTAAGTDFRSDKLWDAYINWEEKNKNLKRVTAIYDRVLAIPTHLYSHNFENFIKHVENHEPKDILSLDEFLNLRNKIVSNTSAAAGTEGDDSAPDPPGVDAPPGVEAPPGLEMETKVQSENEETKALRDLIIEARKAIHQRTEEEVSKRWSHEEGIRRPYFHVKPLEKTQLKNWRDYLDFEIDNGTHERVVVLFERCMIACALYEEFWIKYAKYMEPHSIEGVRHVFKRACKIHLPKKPNIHLAWAAFEERQGNLEGAREVLCKLEERIPGLAMVALRRISLERRRANFSETEELYKEYIAKGESTEVKTFYAIKYARYLAKVLVNTAKAKEVLMQALEEDENNHKLYLQLIDLEYQQANINEADMLKLFDKALSSQLAIEHRVAFSQRKLEFQEDFGSSINRLLEAYEEHQKLVKELQTSRKRKSVDSEEDGQPEKKIKTEYSASSNGTGDMSNTGMNTTHSMDTNTATGYNYSQAWSGYQGGYGYQHPSWGAYGTGYYGGQ